MSRVVRDPLERYLEKVDKRSPDECWPWTAARFDKGYGAFRVGHLQVKAHRFGHKALVGPIPDGLSVCHTCDNPPCQNPGHWFLGTTWDNAHDRERKGRGRYGTVGPIVRVRLPQARGERNGNSRLTEDAVRWIHQQRALGRSQQSIADDLAVSQVTVSLVLRGRIWTHVEPNATPTD